ncbi:MAG: hypothetical protein VX834_09080, partial [Myxococcota bacterium]|nr:hypothetical protein [Myxococcota bacterium]
GFASDTRLFFDGREAQSLTVVSNNRLVARTPAAGSAGQVDVRVETLGIDHTASNFYSYFDPADLNNWTGGGPVSGAVNITVIDTGGQRLENAFVMLGDEADPDRSYLYGFTDSRGQITLSGPEVFGPQNVHAGKAEFGNFSWIETDSQNLTMQLTPREPAPPDPLPECPEGTQVAAPIIKGNVYRIKDDLNLGNDFVVVTTSHRSFSEQLPDPGPNAQLVSNGPFELFARTGDMVLLALAGEVTPDGNLNVHAMGFRPFVFTEASSGEVCDTDDNCSNGEQCMDFDDAGSFCMKVYDNMDITIDTPLKQPLEIKLDEPPLQGVSSMAPGLPTHASVNVWYDFGYMGVHMMGSSLATSSDTLYVDMPQELPSTMDFTVFNVDSSVAMSYDGSLYPPQSDTRNHGLTDTTQRVIATPFLKTHQKLGPLNPNSSAPMNFEVDLLPETEASVLPTGNMHWVYNFETIVPCEGAMPISRPIIYWMAVSHGQNKQFNLPIFPQQGELLNLSSDVYYWQLMALYAPQASYDSLNLNSLFNWKSRALYVSNFTYTE